MIANANREKPQAKVQFGTDTSNDLTIGGYDEFLVEMPNQFNQPKVGLGSTSKGGIGLGFNI